MSDQTLNTVLVNAMNEAKTHGSGMAFLLEGTELWVDDNMSMDADRFATAIRDHFLDRDLIASILIEIMDDMTITTTGMIGDPDGQSKAIEEPRKINGLKIGNELAGHFADRLIEGLSK